MNKVKFWLILILIFSFCIILPAYSQPAIKDNVANYGDSMDEIIFGTGFGCITDVKLGPDGLLYIVSYSDGTIYRIVPKSMEIATSDPSKTDSLISYLVYPAIAAAGIASFFAYRKSSVKVHS